MNAKERLDYASNLLNAHLEDYRAQAKFLVDRLKDVLKPCGDSGCLVGSDDYCDDIFYVYAEPKPNDFYRVKAIRNLNDNLEVFLDLPSAGDYSYLDLIDGNWLDFDRARVVDLHLLTDEVVLNLEYSDGYQDIEDYLIDGEGNPYVVEKSFPAGGGLDKRCDYNAEALYAFNVLKGYDAIVSFFTKRDFTPGCQSGHLEEWFKGNTRIILEVYDGSLENYAYLHTEYLPEAKEKPEGEEREYDVPFLRTQWADVRVKARSRAEAREKAEAMFREGKDGWVDWEDVDVPTFDNEHDITLAP